MKVCASNAFVTAADELQTLFFFRFHCPQLLLFGSQSGIRPPLFCGATPSLLPTSVLINHLIS